MIVEAYHAPAFYSIVLAVRILSKDFEVLFSNSIRNFPGCFLRKKRSFNIINEYPFKDGLYPVQYDSMKQKFQAYSIRTNPVDQWHRKLGIFILIVSINFLYKIEKPLNFQGLNYQVTSVFHALPLRHKDQHLHHRLDIIFGPLNLFTLIYLDQLNDHSKFPVHCPNTG